MTTNTCVNVSMKVSMRVCMCVRDTWIKRKGGDGGGGGGGVGVYLPGRCIQ